jgi:hypothetical protein
MNLLGVMPAKEGKVKVKSKKGFYFPYFCFYPYGTPYAGVLFVL